MNYAFQPARVFFEPAALQYPRGRALFVYFQEKGIPTRMTTSHNQVRGIPGANERELFAESKQTLVIGVRRGKTFQTCKPSAQYQLPLATGCPGRCHYCYLHTTLGKKPYLRAYINVGAILKRAGEYIAGREPELTFFEGAAVSDPLFVEPFTGGVSAAISFFAHSGRGRFRLATKHARVEPYLKLEHRGHTHFRFSVNAPEIIERLEENTPSLEERLAAAVKMIAAGYPTGFIVAPIFLDGGWKDRYRLLLDYLVKAAPGRDLPLTFELITHRFTLRARENIAAVHPNASLDMDISRRRFRYGQFGYGKYLYPPGLIREAAAFFKQEIKLLLPGAAIEYFI